jgi:hypothetical protein
MPKKIYELYFFAFVLFSFFKRLELKDKIEEKEDKSLINLSFLFSYLHLVFFLT